MMYENVQTGDPYVTHMHMWKCYNKNNHWHLMKHLLFKLCNIKHQFYILANRNMSLQTLQQPTLILYGCRILGFVQQN